MYGERGNACRDIYSRCDECRVYLWKGEEMTSKTHVLGGMALGIGGYMYSQKMGLTIDGVSPILQLGIILPYAIWSSTLPDLDQDNDDVAERNPINLVLQKFFNLIRAGHRSAKSHIYPMLVALVCYVLCLRGVMTNYIPGAGGSILQLITLGMFLGLFSHFLLDIMTEAGVQVGRIRLRIVPRMAMFGTGTTYELVVRRLLYVVCCALLVLVFRG